MSVIVITLSGFNGRQVEKYSDEVLTQQTLNRTDCDEIHFTF